MHPHPYHQNPMPPPGVSTITINIPNPFTTSQPGMSTNITADMILDEVPPTETVQCITVLKRRRKKMRKHKYEKLRKNTRFERRRMGKK